MRAAISSAPSVGPIETVESAHNPSGDEYGTEAEAENEFEGLGSFQFGYVQGMVLTDTPSGYRRGVDCLLTLHDHIGLPLRC